MNSVSNQTQPPIAGVGHDYQHLLGETVNFSNGSVSLKIPFPIVKGRGITLPDEWSYNSAEVNPLDSINGNMPYWDLSSNHFWPRKDGWNIASGAPSATVQVWQQTQGSAPPSTTIIPCNYQSGMTFTDLEGATHNLNAFAISPAGVNNSEGFAYACPSGPESFTNPPTGDGQVVAWLDPSTSSGSSLLNNTPVSGPFTVTDKNGFTYQFSCCFSAQSPGSFIPAEVITDRNGNYISNGTDTMGRKGTIVSSGTINPTATQPSTVTITVNPGTADQLTFTSIWATTAVNYQISAQGGADPSSGTSIMCFGVPNTVGPQYLDPDQTLVPGSNLRVVLSSLQLPNGQQYQFFYNDPYGLLSEVIFPDGGWIKYTWELTAGFNEMSSFGGETITGTTGEDQFTYGQQPFGCGWQYQTPVLATRQVSYDGSTVAQTQAFTYTTDWQYSSPGYPNGWTGKTTKVVTTDNLRGNSSFQTVYAYTPFYSINQPSGAGAIAPAIPLESSITYYDWGATTPMKSVAKTWLDEFNLTSEITTVYQAVGSPRVSETDYKYQSNLCSNIQVAYTPTINVNPVVSLVYATEQDDYDLGNGTPGPLVKKTLYNYNCFQPPSGNSSPIPPEVSSVTVEDGSGNIKAATQYHFDGSSLVTLPKCPVQSTCSTSTTGRGNITSITKCNPLPATPTAACTGPTTTYTYDYTGQPSQMFDPLGNSTTFSFTDSFSDNSSSPVTNAYLTKITYPDGLQKKFSYGYWMGYLTSSTDENVQQTTYTYNVPQSVCSSTDGTADGMDRLSEVAFPDGGKTFYCYNDSALTTTKKVLLNNSPLYETNVAVFDKMGHGIETQLTSDPDGATKVDTVYDGEGKTETVSNPYRGAGPGSVLTKHYYDALGRDVWAAEQDGSSLQWCYNGLPSAIAPANVRCSNQLGSVAGTTRPGTWVDSTDERGNAWQRTSDVFGNITEVMEPNGTGTTPTMETDYTYDTLSNLAAVTQYGGPSGSTGTRARSFSYDSLSRLLLANNPETGGVSYTYDLDSNLISKTDARGVATLFTYDTLNRLSRKTYSSDPSGTPISCYQYDSSSIAYGKGRLSKAWTQSASTPSPCSSGSPFLTERSILAYDPMGRVTQERQYTMASQAAGAPYSPVYSYDLAGDLISSTSGIGPTPTSSPITLGYTINAAGRLQTVTSNLSTNTIGGTAYTYPTTLFAPVSTGQSSLCTGSTSPTPQYAAFGGLMNAAFGNGLTLNRMFDLRLRTTCELDMGSTGNATGASTTVTITGAEKTN